MNPMTTPASSDNAQDTDLHDERWRHVAVHFCGLVVIIVGLVALQRLHGLLALTLPFGPAVLALPIAKGPLARRHRQQALAYSIVAAVVICVSWFGVRLALATAWFAVTFPAFMLLLLFSLTNYAVMSMVAATKANRGELFEYPWVPEKLLDRLNTEPKEVQLDGYR